MLFDSFLLGLAGLVSVSDGTTSSVDIYVTIGSRSLLGQWNKFYCQSFVVNCARPFVLVARCWIILLRLFKFVFFICFFFNAKTSDSTTQRSRATEVCIFVIASLRIITVRFMLQELNVFFPLFRPASVLTVFLLLFSFLLDF